jgi:hypothetical protein
MVSIDDDVSGVALALSEIDSHICLRFSETGGYFVAYWKPTEGEDGGGYMITTAQDLDHRLVKRVEKIYHECRRPGYSFADELEKTEAKKKAQVEHQASEERGPALEELAFAMRRDLGYDKQRVFVPGEAAA